MHDYIPIFIYLLNLILSSTVSTGDYNFILKKTASTLVDLVRELDNYTKTITLIMYYL